LIVFPSDLNNIYLKYFGILLNLTRFYESLRKLMKAIILNSIFSVKSLTSVLFRPITKYYWHFMILYRDKQNSSVCYCTVSPLGDIRQYFTIVKRKVIFSILQIPTLLWYLFLATMLIKCTSLRQFQKFAQFKTIQISFY
jgi:hypothetical protein